MSAEEFTGRSFGVTPLRGVRAFRVDGLGRLIGARDHVWSPGEQSAGCDETGASPEAIDSGRHDPCSCTCGFYAYYDGVSDFDFDSDGTAPGVVHGVVEGYGLVSVGTRGFRATRARLLAIALPAEDGDPADDPTLTNRGRRVVSLPNHPNPGLGVFLLVLGTIGLGGMGLGLLLGVGAPTPVAALAPLVVAPLLAAYLGFVHGPSRRLPAEDVARVRRNYPDVAVLPTLEALREAYPPDAPPDPDPVPEADPDPREGVATPAPPADPTPENDPDSWTRSW